MHPAITRRTFAAIAIALSLAACDKKPNEPAAPTAPPSAATAKLTVLAAASLSDAFREIGAAFESANPAVKVEFSFAGSNQLRTQLENGSPGDVFASADRKQLDAAIASKVVDAATSRVFAHNQLVVIVPRSNPAKIESLADLARPSLKIIVADKAVPVGNYTRLMLDNAAKDTALGEEFVAAFDASTVSREQSVAAVVAKVALAEADSAITYASDAKGASADKLIAIPIATSLAPRADYLIAATSRATDPKLAAKFIEFILSPQGRDVLSKRGFTPPEPASN